VRRAYPQVKYLWIIEFQKRGIPHFHVWLTLSAETPGLHEYLASTWHRIAEPESEFHYWWHMREENFIPWDMGSGTYLCKYLSKAYQKKIPSGFTGIGRFWGASRGMVGIPDAIMAADLPEAVAFVRTLCRHQETTLRKTKSSRKYHHQARRSPCSQRLPNGAIVARQLLNDKGVRDGIGKDEGKSSGLSRISAVAGHDE